MQAVWDLIGFGAGATLGLPLLFALTGRTLWQCFYRALIGSAVLPAFSLSAGVAVQPHVLVASVVFAVVAGLGVYGTKWLVAQRPREVASPSKPVGPWRSAK